VFLRTLEGVTADNGAEAATIANGASLIEHGFIVILLGAAGEDHDAVTIKGALDNVADALGEGSDRDTQLLVNFLGFRLLEVRAGQLHLDLQPLHIVLPESRILDCCRERYNGRSL
jgi:hypothetical protein